MFGMSNEEMYRRIEHILDFKEDRIRNYLITTAEAISEQYKSTHELKEWISDIANRLEAALANEKENQALKERVKELEKENKWLQTRLKISTETSDILIKKFLIKGD